MSVCPIPKAIMTVTQVLCCVIRMLKVAICVDTKACESPAVITQVLRCSRARARMSYIKSQTIQRSMQGGGLGGMMNFHTGKRSLQVAAVLSLIMEKLGIQIHESKTKPCFAELAYYWHTTLIPQRQFMALAFNQEKNKHSEWSFTDGSAGWRARGAYVVGTPSPGSQP